jgi:hypothetical protein
MERITSTNERYKICECEEAENQGNPCGGNPRK